MKQYLTLLFSDQEVKAVKLDKKGVRLKALFEFKLPEGLVVEGEVKAPEKLGQFLAQIKAKTGLKDQLVIVGLSEQKASTHSLTLPELTSEEIDSAIRLQADSFLPFPYQDEYLDWMLIAKTPKNKNKVLVSAVPKRVIDNFSFCLEKAGFQPIAFETTSLSLLRLLPLEAKQLCFAAELGDAAVVLILGVKGTIEACSVIEKPQEILKTIKKMTDFYFPEKSPQARPKKIYLCGKNASQKLFEEVKQTLGLEPVLLAAGVAGIAENRQVQLAILLSLAKKIVAPPEDIETINILPQRLMAKYKSLSEKKKENILASALAFLLVICSTTAFFTYWYLQAKNKKFQDQIEGQKNQVSHQLPPLETLDKQAQLINRVSGQKDLLPKILTKVAALSSPKVEVLGFNFDGAKNQLAISGRAQTRDDLLEFKQKLESEEAFTQVFVPLSALSKEKEIEFRATVSLKH